MAREITYNNFEISLKLYAKYHYKSCYYLYKLDENKDSIANNNFKLEGSYNRAVRENYYKFIVTKVMLIDVK